MSDLLNKVNISELSRLTGRTRPSIYKYLDEYISNKYKDIPNQFIQLFKMIDQGHHTKDEIISFCNSNFTKFTYNDKLNDIMVILKNNANKINLEKLEKYLMEEINND